MSGEALLTIKNNHGTNAGIPPTLETGDQYTSYFENEYGEQWVFTWDGSSNEFALHGGNIGWENPITTQEDFTDLILNNEEQLWVLACLTSWKGEELFEKLIDSWVTVGQALARLIVPQG